MTWRMTGISSKTSPLRTTTSIAPSRYVLAALPTFKSKHVPIQAPVHRIKASPSRVAALAVVVQGHRHQVADSVGFSKHLRREITRPSWTPGRSMIRSPSWLSYTAAVETKVLGLRRFQRARRPSPPGLA
ncbi:hypothetical protein BD310DRAFT_940320 [Dichomitus squalens]|uniref:Uncharacterized protein n=1 Tax=Dichomitus squalens TaxID=114155 RepID=A0A4Q9PGT0_9APHY|nr:hypothetical protein BD310DRAFT_940320 [Dichomitus squalens]